MTAPPLRLLLALLLLVGGCADGGGSDAPAGREAADEPVEGPTQEPTEEAAELVGVQRFPDVIEAELTADGSGTWTLAATLSSPYDTPERYADAFRALTPDGQELGVRILTHDHENEQPFTRSLTGLAIPVEVGAITVQSRDLANGWGGATVTVEVP